MGMNVYFTDPIESRILELDENLAVRNTDDGCKISLKGDRSSYLLTFNDYAILYLK